MAKFVVYAHNRWNAESDIVYVCTCDSEDVANNIASSLYFNDTGGRDDQTSEYDYYVRKEDWIL